MSQVLNTTISKNRIVFYRITTGLVATEFLVGGITDILQVPVFFDVLIRLGYPGYFSIIVGIWKIPGSIAILVPGFPRLKEWAYAGMFFNMTGAVASHIAVKDNFTIMIAPLIFSILVIVSWGLRPPSRRL